MEPLRPTAQRLTYRQALGASVLSGILLALSLPNTDVWPLAWFGLAPLLLAMLWRGHLRRSNA